MEMNNGRRPIPLDIASAFTRPFGIGTIICLISVALLSVALRETAA